MNKIAYVANQDTPSAVEVPATPSGVLTWALGRFGVGAIFLGMLLYIYNDQKVERERQNEDMKMMWERVFSINQDYANSYRDLAKSLDQFSTQIGKLSVDIKDNKMAGK